LVGLAGVGGQLAVVLHVDDAVTISVVVAGVAPCVSVHVLLARVLVERTVVILVLDSVAVEVATHRVGGLEGAADDLLHNDGGTADDLTEAVFLLGPVLRPPVQACVVDVLAVSLEERLETVLFFPIGVADAATILLVHADHAEVELHDALLLREHGGRGQEGDEREEGDGEGHGDAVHG